MSNKLPKPPIIKAIPLKDSKGRLTGETREVTLEWGQGARSRYDRPKGSFQARLELLRVKRLLAGEELNPNAKINSRKRRKIAQIKAWKKSVHHSWQQWKTNMYFAGKSLKTS